MTNTIQRAAVLGSGVMGSGIAAHLANAGISCLLLDIIPPGGVTDEERRRNITENDRRFRNRLAMGAKERALKASTSPFYCAADGARVEVGNVQDDLHRLKECDWIVEAVTENLATKRNLFDQVARHARPDAILSSNTSGLRLADLLEGMDVDFQRRFLVTHFFNPVRFMRLLEIIPGPLTDRDVVGRMVDFGRDVLGKGVVMAKDTPNFIANRIGIFAMMEAMRIMQTDGYTVDEVDAVLGPPLGRPRSAVFRTADMVGLDTFVHVADNCLESLATDEMRPTFEVPQFLREMVSRGWLGDKKGQGFYKREGGETLTLDVRTLEYRPRERVRSPGLDRVKDMEDVTNRIRTMCYGEDRLAHLAWKATSRVLAYTARRVGEICDDLSSVDRAMRWGYAWELGPFETWDALGVGDAVGRMERDGTLVDERVREMLRGGRPRFYDGPVGSRTWFDFARGTAMPVSEDARTIRLPALKHEKRTVQENGSASIVDVGDGILCLEFHSRMNCIDPAVIEMMHAAVERAERDFLGLVVANEGANFSIGANLAALIRLVDSRDWGAISRMVRSFQDANRRMRSSRVPVVAAPFGLTLGAGCEICLWAPSVRAHAELYMGLAEVGVGLIPSGGGTVEMTFRAMDNAPDEPTFPFEALLKRSLETVANARTSTSAEDARTLRFLRPSDGITLNRDHLLYGAKQQALGLALAGYTPPRPRAVRLPGPTGRAAFGMGLTSMKDGHLISEHDLLITSKLAHVMTGGDTSPRLLTTEEHLLDLEREAFLSLCGEQKTRDRMEFMLKNNRPLRN